MSYQSLPIRIALVSLVLPASMAIAGEVYRAITPEGRTEFTDRPLPDAIRVPLPTADSQSGTSTQAPATDAWERGFRGSYESFEILMPQNGTTIRDPEGVVQVGLLLDPPLMQTHQISIVVDGVKATGDLGTQTQMTLRGVAIGTHRLQAQVIDDVDNVVSSTPMVNFHMREPLPTDALP